MRAAWRRFWRLFLLDRQIRSLEIEQRYHQQMLAFTADRLARIDVALTHSKRARRLLDARAHTPSLTLVNGSRR